MVDIPNKKNPDKKNNTKEYPLFLVESADTDFFHVAETEEEARKVATIYVEYTQLPHTRYPRRHDVSIFRLRENYDLRFDEHMPDPGEDRKHFNDTSYEWEDFVKNWSGNPNKYNIEKP